MALHLQPMSSRERASVLAVTIAALVWIGAFGCISSPWPDSHMYLKPVAPVVYEGMSLTKFKENVPTATPAGHRIVDGVHLDAHVWEESLQRRDGGPPDLRKRWLFFHKKRLVLESREEAWDRAAGEVTKQRQQDEAEARRMAPMGDSW